MLRLCFKTKAAGSKGLPVFFRLCGTGTLLPVFRACSGINAAPTCMQQQLWIAGTLAYVMTFSLLRSRLRASPR
jgi:hypothetical protein